MLSHSFDRFYVVAKFELPKVEDLRYTTVDFDSKCSYLASNDTYLRKLVRHCLKIMLYMEFFKRQIRYYKNTAQKMDKCKISLVKSPKISKHIK